MKRARTLAIMLAMAASSAAGVAGAPALAEGQGIAGITYADQPKGIELSVYVTTWPLLEPDIRRLQTSRRASVETELQQRAASAGVSDGELNLLAQLKREDGAFDAADKAITMAAQQRPNQFLHPLQQAMIAFARLQHASGMMERWKWHQRTRDAYQRTFDLNPRSAPARYYLAYTYMNTPAIGGGDKNKALELSDGGVALGLSEFYLVRADAHRLRGELDAAFSDYNAAIERRVFDLSAFLAAGQAALQHRQWEPAKRYFEWAVHCRGDAARAHEGLGDYYVAVNDVPAAVRSYEMALQKEPARAAVKEKLAKLAKGSH
jgi:tetratricopeptide (TPR) repeat protein